MSTKNRTNTELSTTTAPISESTIAATTVISESTDPSKAESKNKEKKTKESKWIQKAKLKKGAFTKKATAAGMTVSQYAAHVLKPGSGASAKTKRQAALAQTFGNMAKKKKKGK